MDPGLLRYYNRELQHVREVGAEFAREFPKIAGRLGLDEFECTDPYVERLFEGFAFLAARVQLKLDAEFPAFTQHLLDIVYPHYLAPTPSLAVVQFQPDLNEATLIEGHVLPRGTAIHSHIARDQQTPCEYRTAHEVTLFPLDITEAEYLPSIGAVSAAGAATLPGTRAGLRLRLQTPPSLTLGQLRIDSLPIFLRGSGDLPYRLHQLIGSATQALTLGESVIRHQPTRAMGFAGDEALLPQNARSFEGYRLLQEYFCFPERFLFVELRNLLAGIQRCQTPVADIILLFDRTEPALVNTLDASNFALFCAPAANLFPKRADRLLLNPRQHEQHIVVDRTRPMDFEVHSVQSVTGFGANAEHEREFLPFYGLKPHRQSAREKPAYYTLRREQRLIPSRQRRAGARSSYIGSETFIALVDLDAAPYSSELKQLGLETLCSNRDLPLVMPIGVGTTDFTLNTGAPVKAIRCVSGPTRPRPSLAQGGTAWRLINHLSLNYLSLSDSNPTEGAAALRELLKLYGDAHDPAIQRQIDGLVSIRARNAVRRIHTRGPIVVGRGLEITLEFDAAAYEGVGCYVLGSVLEHFLAAYAAINTFTETVLRTSDHGEMMRWPARTGQRQTI